MIPKQHHIGNISPEFALLGFLILGPSHGYDLHQRLLNDLGHVWHLSQSQAYAILKRLEERGDISAQIIKQQKLPARQILHITERGRLRFFEWLEARAGKNSRSIRLEFLTRLYFTRLLRPENLVQIYKAQTAEIHAAIARLERLYEQLPVKQVFNRLSLDLRLRQMRLIQNWMAEIQAQFQTPKE
jgi:DNA-binding PadR family transcriptional regulator